MSADPFEAIRGRLVVSCQAPVGSPLRVPAILATLAAAAEAGGAAAIRAEGGPSITAIRHQVGVPVIGLRKREVEGSPVYITPDVSDAVEVVDAGADVLAVDATRRARPGGEDFAAFLRRVRDAVGDIPLMADVDDAEAGRAARAAGADVVATTLSGYTGSGGSAGPGPDVALVQTLVNHLDCPVIAEGRYATPADVAAAFEAGAHAVVVGTAITDVLALTRRFAAAAPGGPPPSY